MELKGEFALVQNIVETHALFFHDVNFHVFAHPFFKGNFLKVHRKLADVSFLIKDKSSILFVAANVKEMVANQWFYQGHLLKNSQQKRPRWAREMRVLSEPFRGAPFIKAVYEIP